MPVCQWCCHMDLSLTYAAAIRSRLTGQTCLSVWGHKWLLKCVTLQFSPHLCLVPQKIHCLMRKWMVSLLPPISAQSQIPTGSKAEMPWRHGGVRLSYISVGTWLFHSLYPVIMVVEDLSHLPGTVSGFLQDTIFTVSPVPRRSPKLGACTAQR